MHQVWTGLDQQVVQAVLSELSWHILMRVWLQLRRRQRPGLVRAGVFEMVDILAIARTTVARGFFRGQFSLLIAVAKTPPTPLGY